MSDERFRQLLRQHWGYDDFRGIQLPIIRSIATGRDTLGLMPTGGGKSITFQVPALAMEGLCLVITPLIALMKDQVDNLLQRHITATSIHSGLSHEEIVKRLDNAVHGAYKFLYVSPERLGTDFFLTKLRHMKICFITVDEAHCISQWGYDFRPSYLRISDVRKELPDVAVLALTATATPRVVEDMMHCLQFRLGEDETDFSGHVFRMSFLRKNLSYVVRRAEDKNSELLHILQSVPGSAIVYTRSREGTRDIAKLLKNNGISAIHFHAGLNDVDKDVRQRAWQEGDIRVMVATNAFGMGIDKPDVRLVVHIEMPDSLEAYFQEAGRAGRDGNRAYAVLLYNKADRTKMQRRIPETFPEKEFIRTVYDKLAYFFELAVGDGYQVTYELPLERFCTAFKVFPTHALSAIRILQQAGYVEFREEDDARSRVLFITTREELYRLNHLPPLADAIIRILLRHYTGLFADYAYINEKLLAVEADCTEQEVYDTLVLLTHQRILHYIPRKRVPRLRYLQRRVPHEEVVFSRAVYEERLENYKERISAMTDYTEHDDICRSRLLLAYFGEDLAHDCGCCDVCISRKQASRPSARTAILSTLADGKPHRPEEIRYEGFSSEALKDAYHELTAEGRIVLEDGFLRLIENP